MLSVQGGYSNGMYIPKAGSISGVGNNLTALLSRYSVNSNYSFIKQQSLLSAQKQLNNIAMALSSGKFKSGKELTPQGLSRAFLQNLISTNIAEGLGVMMGA